MEITAEISLDTIENPHKFAAEFRNEMQYHVISCASEFCVVPLNVNHISPLPSCSHSIISLYIHDSGKTNPPLVFFNERLIGGSEDLQQLEAEGKLDQMVKECLESPDPDFPPPCRKPDGIEFVKVSTSLQH